MFSTTEIKIINCLRERLHGKSFPTASLENCDDVQVSLYLLQKKGIITIGATNEKIEILGDVALTDFGYTYPM